jgi:hypothetical protein
LREVEDGFLLGHTDDPYEVVHDLGNAERGQCCATGIDESSDVSGGWFALEQRQHGE